MTYLRLASLCGDITFGEVGSGGAVGCGGDDVAQRLGSHIAYGEHAGDAGPGGLVGNNVTCLIQSKLTVQ